MKYDSFLEVAEFHLQLWNPVKTARIERRDPDYIGFFHRLLSSVDDVNNAFAQISSNQQ